LHVFGHAINASEITPVCYGKTKIVNFSFKRIY
jgi:hypothetical protein